MNRRNFNGAEARRLSQIGHSKGEGPGYVGDSSVTRSPEEALHAEIQGVVENFKGLNAPMRERMLADIHRAQHALPDDKVAARKRLAKFGIQEHWPDVVFSVVAEAINEEKYVSSAPTGNEAAKTRASEQLDAIMSGGEDSSVDSRYSPVHNMPTVSPAKRAAFDALFTKDAGAGESEQQEQLEA